MAAILFGAEWGLGGGDGVEGEFGVFLDEVVEAPLFGEEDDEFAFDVFGEGDAGAEVFVLEGGAVNVG